MGGGGRMGRGRRRGGGINDVTLVYFTLSWSASWIPITLYCILLYKGSLYPLSIKWSLYLLIFISFSLKDLCITVHSSPFHVQDRISTSQGRSAVQIQTIWCKTGLYAQWIIPYSEIHVVSFSIKDLCIF